MVWREAAQERLGDLWAKRTRGRGLRDRPWSAEKPFYISANEAEFSRTHVDNHRLYRVYGYDEDHNSGNLYIDVGSIVSVLDLSPIQYRAVRS